MHLIPIKCPLVYTQLLPSLITRLSLIQTLLHSAIHGDSWNQVHTVKKQSYLCNYLL